MEKELLTGTIGTAVSAVGTATQTNEMLQTISLVITIIGGLITFIIVPLVSWYQKAKKDGKIDANEAKEGAKIIIEGSQEIKNQVEEQKKGK